MKKLVALFIMMVMVLSATACFAEEPAFISEPGKIRYLDKEWEYTEDGKRIVDLYFVLDQFDESTQDELFAVQNRAEEINAESDEVYINFLGYSEAQSNLADQVNDVEAAIALDPDVIYIKCVDSVGIIPSLQAIYEAGIYVVEKTGCDTDFVDIHWQGTDEITIGRKLAAFVKDYLLANPDVNFKAGLIWGAPEQVEQLKRLIGFQELAAEMPDRFEILVEQYGMWDTMEAQNIMEDWLQAYPEMNFIVTAADQMTLGATNAMKGANKLEDFYVVSVNGNAHDINLMTAGETKVFAGFITSETDGRMVDSVVEMVMGRLAGQDNHISNADRSTYICTPDKLEEYKVLKGTW